MLRQVMIFFGSICFISAWFPQHVISQSDLRSGHPAPNPVRAAYLPTDRSLRVDDGLPLDRVVPPGDYPNQISGGTEESLDDKNAPQSFKSRMRPSFDLSAEWEPEVGGLSINSYDLSMRMPVYPFFGPPPPVITTGYSLTQIGAPRKLDLPESLQEFVFGLAWMRRIDERWMARLMLNGAFASDMHNTSSDAWQIRGGLFALYRPNELWNFAFGALATGREDIPVLPAVGAIWEPSSKLKINLMLPNPKISYLLKESTERQHWGYLGGGLSGGTWAYQRASGIGERLSYREFRLLLGWESMPPQPPGTFRPQGPRINVEVGYLFGRKFEFDDQQPDISIGNTILLRSGLRF